MAKTPSVRTPKVVNKLRLGGSGASEQTKPMPIIRATPATGGGGVASNSRTYPKGK